MKKIIGVVGGTLLLLLSYNNVFAGGPWNASSAQFGASQVACLMDTAANSSTIDNMNFQSRTALSFLTQIVIFELEASKQSVVNPVLMAKVKYLQGIANMMYVSINTVLNAPNQQKLYRAKMAAKYAHILNDALSKLVPSPSTGCG